MPVVISCRSFSQTSVCLLICFVLGLLCGPLVYRGSDWYQIQGHLEPKKSPNWTRPANVTILQRRIAVEPVHVCNNTPIRLVFVVLSSPDSGGARKRSAVRKSWPLAKIYKTPPLVHVTLKFVLGILKLSKKQFRDLTNEQAKFGDLLFENHHDTYYHLTEKVRKALQWVDKNVEFDYLIKTDDDCVVRLDNMVEGLRKMGCPGNLYWGHFFTHGQVFKAGKWKETKWNVCETYIPYATGNGYVLGRRIVQSLMKYGGNLTLFTSEDVSVGLWLSPYHLTQYMSNEFPMRPSCSNSAVITHFQGNTEKLEKATQKLLKSGTIC